jgi:hypothetical protein
MFRFYSGISFNSVWGKVSFGLKLCLMEEEGKGCVVRA